MDKSFKLLHHSGGIGSLRLDRPFGTDPNCFKLLHRSGGIGRICPLILQALVQIVSSCFIAAGGLEAKRKHMFSPTAEVSSCFIAAGGLEVSVAKRRWRSTHSFQAASSQRGDWKSIQNCFFKTLANSLYHISTPPFVGSCERYLQIMKIHVNLINMKCSASANL